MIPAIVPTREYLSTVGVVKTATWTEVLRRTALHTEIYTIPTEGQDPQEPHTEDELYYLLEGSATIQIAGVDSQVAPGSLIYVPAGARHHFHTIERSLCLLVFFARLHVPLPASDGQPATVLPGQVAPPGPMHRVRYRELIRSSSMSAGVYELPAFSRDHQTPHADDEIYYVLSGTSEIMLGETSHEAEPGMLIYVPAGMPHLFHQITTDLRLLAVFAPIQRAHP